MKKRMILAFLTIFLLALAGGGGKEVRKTYFYEKGGFGGDFVIQVNGSGTFAYYEGNLSSHLGYGSWTVEDGVLTLTEEAGQALVNRFRIDGDELIFLSEDSSGFIYVKVADGEKFTVR